MCVFCSFRNQFTFFPSITSTHMNPVDQESTCKDDDHEKVVVSSSDPEPGHLLDESWFFGNLLLFCSHKPRMSRCYSDPSPSSFSSSSSMNYYSTEQDTMTSSPPPSGSGKSLEETFSLLQKLPAPRGEMGNSQPLVRTPSLPEDSSLSSSASGAVVAARGKRSQRRLLLHRGNSYSTTPNPTPTPTLPPLPVPVSTGNSVLSRAPSLPSSMGRRKEEIQDDESDFSMSRLIRQASLKQSDTLPPKNLPIPIPIPIPKNTTPAPTTTPPPSRPRKPEIERAVQKTSAEGTTIKRQQAFTGGNKLTRSSSDVVFQELGGLDIKFEKSDVNLTGDGGEGQKINRDNKIPNTQSFVEDNYSMRRGRSQLQKQLSMDSRNSNNNKKSVEDMKAQIKFWARAVASNVRQEC